MRRIGKIVSINQRDGSGKIIDTNDQDIPFFFTSTDQIFETFEWIEFDIILTDRGLSAVNIKLMEIGEEAYTI